MRPSHAMLFLALFASQALVSAGQSEFLTIPASSYETLDYATHRLRVKVLVSEFLIGRYEVTQKQYVAIVGANPSHYKGDDRPVENVSWFDAIRYCNLRSRKEGLRPCYDLSAGKFDTSCTGYRLPTSTEWTVASAGVDMMKDSKNGNVGIASTRSGRQLLELVQEKGTTPVGSYAPNRFGAYDMFGNVWEWCYDWYRDNIYNERMPERAAIAVPSLSDPMGPPWGHLRVIRGGSFVSSPPLYAGEHRGYRGLRPDTKSMFTGFRLARTAPTRAKGETSEESSLDWAKPYQLIPKGMEGRGDLPSLLMSENGQAITSVARWERKRKMLKEKWIKLLGVPPDPQQPPVVRLVKTFQEEIYTGRLIFLEYGQGVWIKIFLMVPRKPLRTPTPAVIVNYYDVDASASKDLGGFLADDRSLLHGYGYMMVQQGYIAVALQWWNLTEESYEESMAKLLLRFPGCTGLGRLVWDTHRVVDYINTLPEVDHDNIGVVGHCLGGLETIYAFTFDDRIKAAVALGSDCSISNGDTNYYDYWYLGEEISNSIPRSNDQQELFSLMAPRAFLLDLGKGNTIDVCFPFVGAAREVYRLYGKEENIGYVWDREERPPSVKNVSLARSWLMHFLGQ